jgi:hypothetical protein
MKWRNTLSLCFFPLMILFFFMIKEREQISAPKVQTTQRKIASTPLKISHIRKHHVNQKKAMHLLKGRALSHSILRNRIPQSVENTLVKDLTIELTKGHEFLKDVAAIAKDKYQPSMGEIISRNDEFIFFKAPEGNPYAPVAISQATNTFYPISTILHIKGVTPAVRDELMAQGHKEYYYHPPMKFLSLETRPGEVMKVYNDLRKQGHQVELEVLKPGHQTN